MRWVGNRVSSVAAEQRSGRCVGGVSPRMDRMSVVFPEPFEPRRQVMRPRLDPERHVLQHVRPVVAGEHVLHDQRLVGPRHVSPRYARRTSASAATSAKVPSQSFLP